MRTLLSTIVILSATCASAGDKLTVPKRRKPLDKAAVEKQAQAGARASLIHTHDRRSYLSHHGIVRIWSSNSGFTNPSCSMLKKCA